MKMASKKSGVWFLCFLMMGTFILSMAQNANTLSDNEINDIAQELLKGYMEELEESEDESPINPENDFDNEEAPRAWWSFLKWIPKAVMSAVKAVAKAGPFIKKALVYVKNKVVSLASKISNKYLTKEAIKSGIKNVVKEGVETLIVDEVGGRVTDAVNNLVSGKDDSSYEDDDDNDGFSSGGSTSSGSSNKDMNIFDFYDNNEVCDCSSKITCGCCVRPPKFQLACFNITIEGTLWDNNAKLHLGANYGGTNILTRRMPVKVPGQKCVKLSAPFSSTKMCFSTHGRSHVGNRMIQCISLHFNNVGTTKCLVQNKQNRIWFRENV